jgi:hypothetical protein
VEGSTPSEMEEEPADTTSNVSVRGAGNVWAPATWDNFAPTIEKKTMDNGENLHWLEPYQEAVRDEQP